MRHNHPQQRADESMPPMLGRLSDYVSYGALAYPERPAVMTSESVSTYLDLNKQVSQLARALLARNVGPGDRIAILSPPCPQFLELFLAAISIGAIVVGLNPKYSRRELLHPLADCGPSIVFSRPQIDDRAYLTELAKLRPDLEVSFDLISLGDEGIGVATPWSEFVSQAGRIPNDVLARRTGAVAPDDVCLIVYTSGTTGTPKGAMLTHRGLVYCSHTDARYNLYAEGQRILCNFPINHIACVGDVCATTLVVGGAIHFMEAFDPRGVLQAVETFRLTHLGQIPAMLQMELSVDDLDTFDLSSLKQILWGGNSASIDLVRRLRDICPNLANVYGMTETTGNVIFLKDAGAPDDMFATTIGWPPEEYEVGIFRSDSQLAEILEVGEIFVRGPFLMTGYWQKPEATQASFTQEGWLKTGDLARQNEDGSYSIVGRRTQMYKSGGYNIYPAEVEQVIESHPGVAMAAVVSVPDALYSEVGHAFVLHGSEELTEAGVVQHCRDHLANYKVPKRFTILPELPMLPNGKIDRLRLKAIAEGRP